ncbi:hypothetical protein [Ralstonia sp. 24A2]|uniref:hypothetical protein n=1 Tax=Ralstonia sp. 24A2 TaxID=3447364 RepID=UPI003F6A09C9
MAYTSANHLTVATCYLAGRGGVDVELAAAGCRQMTTQIPSFGIAPYVLVRSNLVCTTTRAFVSHDAALLPLCVEPLPEHK